MKKLLATIALLCLSSTVLAHDIYSTLRDRDGNLCCGGQIVNQLRLQCCRMVTTICQRAVKPFPPTRRHHHPIIASTIVPIIMCILGPIPGVIPYGTPHPRPDASLLQCTLR